MVMIDLSGIGLSPRTTVRSDAQDAFEGRLGLLVYDTSVGNVIALTSAQLMHGATALFHDGIPIGRTSSNVFPNPKPARELAAYALIRPLLIRRTCKIAISQSQDEQGAAVRDPTLDAVPRVGEEVLIQLDHDGPTRALLHSDNGHFFMPTAPGAELTFVSGALELSKADGEPATRAGDIGALVSNLKGHPLGIVICGVGGTSFAAPLAPAIAAVGDCAPLTDECINEWNISNSNRYDLFNVPSPYLARDATPPKTSVRRISSKLEPPEDDAALLEWSRSALEECFDAAQ
jgi:hypothetical protein